MSSAQRCSIEASGLARARYRPWPTLLAFLAFIPLSAGLSSRGVKAETLLERGSYLVNGIGNCGNCHSPQEPDGTLSGPALSGGHAISSPAFTAYPPNLTPHHTGIGGWTEDQIAVALREGRTPEGKILRPPMPVSFYRSMSDRDAHAIAIYLRSLRPIANRVPASTYKLAAPQSYGPPVTHVPDPDPADRTAVGKYLVTVGHCMLCHTPAVNGHPDLEHQLGAGGAKIRGVFGERVTPNITPDRETGIGSWTAGEIKTALTKGLRPDGRLLASPMPWRYLSTMKDADIDAIVAYLQSLPPIQNRVN